MLVNLMLFLIDAANFGDLLDFMGTSPVQEIISKMWFGGLEPEGRIGPFLCALFFPPIAPILLEPTQVKGTKKNSDFQPSF